MGKQQLSDALKPMLERLTQLDMAHPATEAILNQEFSDHNPRMMSVVSLAKQGIAEGWLCDRENAGVKFSRIAKSTDETFSFSIDAVLMSGEGAAHTHTNGEVSICIPMKGDPSFDDFDYTWAHYPPGSSHTPTVTGGTMLIIYFLPEGAVEWL